MDPFSCDFDSPPFGYKPDDSRLFPDVPPTPPPPVPARHSGRQRHCQRPHPRSSSRLVNPFSSDFDSPPIAPNYKLDDSGLFSDVPPTPPTPHPPYQLGVQDADADAPPLPPTVVDDISKKRKVDGSPARKPPAWELNYKLGSGAYGTVYLEKVQTPSMRSSELWAVKKISRCSPNFPAKRYQAEISNLRALSNVGSAQTWFISYLALVSFELSLTCQ